MTGRRYYRPKRRPTRPVMTTRSERDRAMSTVAWAAALLFAAIFASECARAQEQEVAFRAGVTATYSDNATRTISGQSATALDGLVGLSVTHQSPLLYVDAHASALERGYVE